MKKKRWPQGQKWDVHYLEVLEYSLPCDAGLKVDIRLVRVALQGVRRWAIKRGEDFLSKRPTEGYFFFLPDAPLGFSNSNSFWDEPQDALDFWIENHGNILIGVQDAADSGGNSQHIVRLFYRNGPIPCYRDMGPPLATGDSVEFHDLTWKVKCVVSETDNEQRIRVQKR